MWELLFGTGEFAMGIPWLPLIMMLMQGGGMVMDSRAKAAEEGAARRRATRATKGAIGASQARSTQAGTAGAVGAPAGRAPAGLVQNLADIQSAPGTTFPWMDLANLALSTSGSMYQGIQQEQQQAMMDAALKKGGFDNLFEMLIPQAKARADESLGMTDWWKREKDRTANLKGDVDWATLVKSLTGSAS